MTTNSNQPQLDYVTCASPSGLHRMAYWQWGDPNNDKVLLCVHGLTRTGRDFDLLAQALQNDYRVVCPDIVGRGKSDWLIDPIAYAVSQYISDIVTLIAKLNPRSLDWLGTSMGGLIGLGLAGALSFSKALRPNRGEFGLPASMDIPLKRMILNDVGPVLDMSGLARIGDYVGAEQVFDSFDEAVNYVKTTSPGFGEHDAAGWAALTEHVFNQIDGKWYKHYDLRMSQAFAAQTPEVIKASEVMLWQAWSALPDKAMIIRGADSDLLSQQTVAEMLSKKPNAVTCEFSNVGHAPMLRNDEQIKAVCDFLL